MGLPVPQIYAGVTGLNTKRTLLTGSAVRCVNSRGSGFQIQRNRWNCGVGRRQ